MPLVLELGRLRQEPHGVGQPGLYRDYSRLNNGTLSYIHTQIVVTMTTVIIVSKQEQK